MSWSEAESSAEATVGPLVLNGGLELAAHRVGGKRCVLDDGLTSQWVIGVGSSIQLGL